MSDDNTAPYTKMYDNPADYEHPEMNRQGGFHPVRLRDILGGKYVVLRKLGYGSCSTVWLAEDKAERFYAVKILAAELYGGSHQYVERDIHRHLRNAKPDHDGYRYVMRLEDTFEIVGPRGRHVCLVFPMMGETLATFGEWWEDNNCLIPTKIMRRLTVQLLLAVECAHESGVIHTDLKPESIFVRPRPANGNAIYEIYLRNNEETREYAVSIEPDAIKSQPIGENYMYSDDELVDPDVVLGDWRLATRANRHLREEIQPVAFRAPEVLIKAPWGPNTDLWNLGAVLAKVLCGTDLFEGSGYQLRKHVHEMVHYFGPFPGSLLSKGDPILVNDLFDGTGRVRDLPPLNRPALEGASFLKRLKREDRVLFVSFLRELMRIDPEERKTVRELLAHPWLADVEL